MTTADAARAGGAAGRCSTRPAGPQAPQPGAGAGAAATVTIDGHEYRSPLAGHIEGLVAAKRALGYSYAHEARVLWALDRFCVDSGVTEATVTRELAADWAEARPGEGESSRQGRMSALRQLALRQRMLGIDAYLPKVPSRTTPAPYLPTRKETRALLEAADALAGSYARAPRLWYVASGYGLALRLMRLCGMRVGEVAALAVADVDAEAGRLLVRGGKGGRDRVVYMAPEVAEEAAGRIRELRDGLGEDVAWLFPGRDPSRHLSKGTITHVFAGLWAKVAGDAHPGGEHPTPHTMRHAFVVDRMNLWMERGVDLGAMMPYLAAYLGHSTADETMYYYHLADEALELLRSRDEVAQRVIPEAVPYE